MVQVSLGWPLQVGKSRKVKFDRLFLWLVSKSGCLTAASLLSYCWIYDNTRGYVCPRLRLSTPALEFHNYLLALAFLDLDLKRL